MSLSSIPYYGSVVASISSNNKKRSSRSSMVPKPQVDHLRRQFMDCSDPRVIEQSTMETGSFFWVNYNISLTWILRPFGDDFPNINHDFQASGEQWGRDQIYPETWLNNMQSSVVKKEPWTVDPWQIMCVGHSRIQNMVLTHLHLLDPQISTDKWSMVDPGGSSVATMEASILQESPGVSAVIPTLSE